MIRKPVTYKKEMLIFFITNFCLILNSYSQQLVNEFRLDNFILTNARFSNNGSLISYMAIKLNNEGLIDFENIIEKVRIYDLNKSRNIFDKEFKNVSLRDLRISNNNSKVVIGGWGPSLEIWNISPSYLINNVNSIDDGFYGSILINNVAFLDRNHCLFSGGHFLTDNSTLHKYNFVTDKVERIFYERNRCSTKFKFNIKYNIALLFNTRCAIDEHDSNEESTDIIRLISIKSQSILFESSNYEFTKTEFMQNEPSIITHKDNYLIKRNWETGISEKIGYINIDLSGLKIIFEDQVMILHNSNKIYFYDIKNKILFDSLIFKYRIQDIDYSEKTKKLALDFEKSIQIYYLNNVVEYLESVDYAIPVSENKDLDRYALIIGNEDYSSFQTGLENESNVPYAKNDALIFKKYAINVLGVPEQNIIININVSAIKMHRDIEKINKIIKNSNGTAEVFVYYAGHGFPDEKTKKSYLIPVDVTATDLKFAIELNDLYDKLTEYPAKKVTVFLDACFSGGGRNESLLATRAPAIKYEENVLKGNIVVFSASSGTQSALAYKKKKHGMFTYYLLKKLQETKGNISYGDLFDYLNKNISIKSIMINEKEQNPYISIGIDIQNKWKQINIKNEK